MSQNEWGIGTIFPEKATGEVEVILNVLAEYSHKLRDAYAVYERDRERLMVGATMSVVVAYVVAAAYLVVRKDEGGFSSWQGLLLVVGLSLSLVPVLFVFEGFARRRRIRAEVSVLLYAFERLIEKVSELYAGRLVSPVGRLLLDVRLSEAEALLYRGYALLNRGEMGVTGVREQRQSVSTVQEPPRDERENEK
ncbi:hypothetical protein [Myxococcus faecalis]|uniref:hypothetical protein n=1 Tax=Myxococcus faecalis TaxID=3115646 RepID=UPI003CF66358